ncbi:MAG: DUF3179 domain-containing protein [bacterium]|nr:DUF3179 domain-containing protein [bacterium]
MRATQRGSLWGALPVALLAAVASLLAASHLAARGASPSSCGAQIDTRQIVRNVVPRDAIPALFRPKYMNVTEARFMRADDRLIAVDYGGEQLAYPTRILDHHEIVNDVASGRPLAITYCPLCGSAVAFFPVVGGRVFTFGVSGDLYNSNLLMYDRQTNSLWLQETGTAVEGPLMGSTLPVYPVAYDTWGNWSAHHPKGRVLSIHTPYEQRFSGYGQSPYAGYASTPELWFYVNRDDKRLPRKARVIGVGAGGAYKAYPEETVWNDGVLDDRIGGIDVVILADRATSRVGAFPRNGHEFSLRGGKVTDERGHRWSWAGDDLSDGAHGWQSYEVIPTFWFAWAAMHPNTGAYGNSAETSPKGSFLRHRAPIASDG